MSDPQQETYVAHHQGLKLSHYLNLPEVPSFQQEPETMKKKNKRLIYTDRFSLAFLIALEQDSEAVTTVILTKMSKIVDYDSALPRKHK